MALQAKLLSHCFSKSCSIVTFQNVVPILHSVICLRWITNYKQKAAVKRKRVVISSCFPWKLLLFIVKRLYNLPYNPISVILCLLRYWKFYLVTHKFKMVEWKKIINWNHVHVRYGTTWKLLFTWINLSFINLEMKK